MTKAEIRTAYLQKRKALAPAVYLQLCQMLCQRFFVSVNLTRVGLLHTYLPIPGKNEPDTWLIIDRLRREYPHIQIAAPRITNNNLEHVILEYPLQIATNTWNIPEPRTGTTVPAASADMVLVPLLAFDEKGNRIGYGKGYYDRFLKSCRPETPRIGLSFFAPLPHVPATPADVPLSACVTPDAFYIF